MRSGGKSPGQKKSMRGVFTGYVENMPAYRVWDLLEKKIRNIAYNFCIAHEGYYPFRDKTNWPSEFVKPTRFYPDELSVRDAEEWAAFDFDDEDATDCRCDTKCYTCGCGAYSCCSYAYAYSCCFYAYAFACY
jgi:hypothetical protein